MEEITDSRWSGNRLQFRIRWLGYDSSHNSFEYADDVEAPDMVRDYFLLHPRSAGGPDEHKADEEAAAAGLRCSTRVRNRR